MNRLESGPMKDAPLRIQNQSALLDPFVDMENEFTADELFRLAIKCQSSGDFKKALLYYSKALRAAPGLTEAAYNIGVLHYEQKQWPEAIRYFKYACDQKPRFAEAVFNLAAALKEAERFAEALQTFERSIQLEPGKSLAHFYLAICYQKTGSHSKAVASFHKAIDLDPDNALFWFHLADSVRKTQSVDRAIECYRKSISLKPEWDIAHYNLAIALRLKERLPEAIEHMHQALQLNPDFDEARAYLFRLAQHACDWQLLAAAADSLEILTQRQLEQGVRTSETPMISLRRQAAPQRNLAIASSWSRHIAQESARLPDRPCFKHFRQATRRLRIGYLSSDFKDHAVAHQIRGLLSAHDRKNFEIFGYVANADDGTHYRRLLCNACDRTRDIHGLSPVATARKIYADGIHILVEMSGYSRDSLLPIAALRPAPIQVSYLGFLGSTGADYMDYAIADAIVVPQAHAIHYSEKVVYMPHCYQANDDQQTISKRSFNRRDFSLPANGFVYCCFNQPYKIDSELFAVWMNILKSVDGSVLWLIERSPVAKDNLRRAAARSGIDPSRLIFTGFIPLADNLARLRLADLALDTRLYNGGATTSNALWAGVPVLTVEGNHWVSRMTASALHAINMPELIAPDLHSYQKMAVELACNRGRLASLRRKLSRERAKAPLFNTRMFTQHLEIAYRAMWARYLNDQDPVSFRIKS
jgi:protein O-GlcNAc transferase